MEPGIEVVSPNLPEHNLQDSHKEHYSSIHPDDRPTNVLPASSAIELRRPRQNIGVLLLVALVTAIVVGAAVGGGLGSQLKQARDHAATEWYVHLPPLVPLYCKLTVGRSKTQSHLEQRIDQNSPHICLSRNRKRWPPQSLHSRPTRGHLHPSAGMPG